MILVIPTYQREGRQITLSSIPGRWHSRTYLACPKKERHDWENILWIPEYCEGSVSKTRQWIVENAPDEHVGMLDDDISFFRVDEVKRTKRHRMDDAGEVFDLMEQWLGEGDVFCGTSGTFMSHEKPDEYYIGKPSHCCFLNTAFLKYQNIRYDALQFFEDFHVPLSILEAGKRLRYTGKFVTDEFKANAAGGCSVTRTAESNRQAMIDLQKLHPKYITLKEDPEGMNQNLNVGLKMRIAFKRCYDDNVASARLPF